MSSRPLNIAILGLHYAPESTGNAPYTTGLAEGLADAGHHVKVITGFPHYPEWRLQEGSGEWSRHEIKNGVELTRLRHYVPARPKIAGRLLMELSFGLRLIFADWGKPDVVIMVSPALFSTGMAQCRVRLTFRRPLAAIWVQDLYSRGVVETGSVKGYLASALATIESRILKSADGVVAIHDRFASHLVDGLGVAPEQVEVIRNWTHLPERDPADRLQTRRDLGWADDEIIVLHAGNMGAKQGLENVVSAARISDARASRVRFVLMGDGNQRRRLEAIGRDVYRLNFLDGLPTGRFQAALEAADVLLVNELPGVRDMAVPSKLTSYFSSGVPVLAATDADSVTAAEISESGGGGGWTQGIPQHSMMRFWLWGPTKRGPKCSAPTGSAIDVTCFRQRTPSPDTMTS
ncbi:glycosyltransferase family 4 protein [Pseudarthrobacter sp. B907]|uniref:glycosyltransferase family 4 protein n=1 Tax=Pseudarthrobacter sp. B907 TaxID=3158261 RepID=UPI0032DAA8CE